MPTVVVVLKFYKLSVHSAVNQFLPDSDVGMSLLGCYDIKPTLHGVRVQKSVAVHDLGVLSMGVSVKYIFYNDAQWWALDY
jgi:hypothetical protein